MFSALPPTTDIGRHGDTSELCPTATLMLGRPAAYGAERSFIVPRMLLPPAQQHYSSRAICRGWSGSSSSTNPEIDTPSSLTAFSSGNTVLSKSNVTDSNSRRLSTEPGNVRLRETSTKSANFTLSVTVRPRVPLSSQCRQTFSISGWSSVTITSNSVRSAKNGQLEGLVRRGRHPGLDFGWCCQNYGHRLRVDGADLGVRLRCEEREDVVGRFTALTGITNDMVAGKVIDPAEVTVFADPADLVIAHNASFDRSFVERFCDVFVHKPWPAP